MLSAPQMLHAITASHFSAAREEQTLTRSTMSIRYLDLSPCPFKTAPLPSLSLSHTHTHTPYRFTAVPLPTRVTDIQKGKQR
jgi:hypothetical protein